MIIRITLILTCALLLTSLAVGQTPAPAGQTRQSGAPLPAGARAIKDIPYVTDGHERQKLDLYLPAKGTNVPLIVWIHGGAWRVGSKDNTRATWLLEEGYAVASVNYRLSQHATFPAQLEDCKAAIRWLRANATKHGYDGNHIGVWGPSAGGHLVALLGVTGDVKDFDKGANSQVSSRVQAVCDFFGPTDLTKMDEQSDTPGRANHDLPDSPESQLIGGPIQQNKEQVARANPLNYISVGDAPFLILHGDQDKTVPIGQSELLHAALSKARLKSTFHVVKGAGHGGPGFETPEVRQMVKSFFDQHLRP